jgi:K+/H+ antiporter YhaU regulatory subunit KhtT
VADLLRPVRAAPAGRIFASRPEQAAARQTGAQLEGIYHLDERRWQLRVPAGSPLVGQSLAALGIGERFGVAVAALWRRREALVIPGPEEVFQAGDALLVIGREERVMPLAEAGFAVQPDEGGGSISARGARFVEVVLAPHGGAEGATLRDLDFRQRYGFTALALLREGQSHRTDVAAMRSRRAIRC